MILKENLIKLKSTINCKGRIIDLAEPKIMGILNYTPDSFYDGGRYNLVDNAIKQVDKMLEEGVDFIDIGAHSTRPGAKMLTKEDEKNRLSEILNEIRSRFSPDLLVSVDTFQSEVASFVIEEFEVDIINDVSGGELDPNMFSVIAKYNVPYIMMHMRGNPQNMQNNTEYDDIVVDILKYFSSKIEKSKQLGINDIILDPGFGFSKTLEQNYELLNRLEEFCITELPLLVGLSRKSMIYKLLEISSNEALLGTSVLNSLALQKGANILRVHDVKEAKQVIELTKMISN